MTNPEFAVVIPQGSKGEFRDSNPTDILPALNKFLRTAEGCGYMAGWIYDHLMSPSPRESAPALEAWTTLSVLAQSTKRIRLGTMVTNVGFRNAGLLAKTTATFDVLTGGRLDLGLGAGWYRKEHEGFNLEFEADRVRATRLGESTELLLRLWSGHPVDYQGSLVYSKGGRSLPTPIQSPHPPIWIGGSGEKITLRTAAQLAQAWNISAPTVAEFKRKNEVLSEWCERFGRRPEEVLRSVELDCIIAPNSKRVPQLLAEASERSGMSASEVRRRHLVGNPRQIAERISEYVECGVQYFVLWFHDGPAVSGLEAFSDNVAPLLRGQRDASTEGPDGRQHSKTFPRR